MSGVAAIFGGTMSPDTPGHVGVMLDACRRGVDDREIRGFQAGAMGVARHAWESAEQFSGAVGCVEVDGITVAADATLYYRNDLSTALRSAGAGPLPGRTSSHYIAQAYRAWGADAAARMEGDFAFLLWDPSRSLLLAGRSLSGKRPLYFWEGGGSLVVASTPGGVLASPRVHAPVDIARVGLQAAGLSAGEDDTPFVGIRALAPGESLTWSPGGSVRVIRYWEPQGYAEAARLNFDEAAVCLRELLKAAVAERLSPGGHTSVWMSGGRDSTAVFAAGHAAPAANREQRIRPVSWRYPEGDPGREDDWISATAERWGESPVWMDPYSIPVLDESRCIANSTWRDEPFVHLFENWNRALARGSFEGAGSRVALDGNGGDQLFGASPHVMSDLLVTGRWTELRRQWLALGGAQLGARGFFENVVRPAVPRWAFAPVSLLRGAPVGYVAQRKVPTWIVPSFAREHNLLVRQRTREWSEQYAGPGQVGRAEMEFYFRSGEVSRYHSLLSSFALGEGVELRSPLSDGRLIAFAFSRPLVERLDGFDSKRLLRAAMKGLVPDQVLATRIQRTGTTRTYFVRSIIQQAPAILRSLGARLALSDAGMVDRAAFLREWDALIRKGEHPSAVQLYRTLHAELWLRDRLGYGRAPATSSTRVNAPGSVTTRFLSDPSSRTEAVHRDDLRWLPVSAGRIGRTGVGAS